MRYLFIHQNFPGQFRHVAAALAAQPEHEVTALGDADHLARHGPVHPKIRVMGYKMPVATDLARHPYLKGLDLQTRRGQAVAKGLLELRQGGYRPDVIVAHPAWGEALFVKDVFPDARLVVHCEFFYRAHGADLGFDPEFPDSFDAQLRLRLRNTVHLLGIEAAELGVSPTHWQRSRYPRELQGKIAVAHEGIDTQVLRPEAHAVFEHEGLRLTRDDEVLTYVARDLEPYRGYHTFMRALPEVLARRPSARVLIVGGDGVSYGVKLPEGQSYRARYWNEVRDRLDGSRVHFTGKLSYALYMQALQVSRCHVYLTYPFVLSWSLLEAMSTGCTVVASDTPPVREVIRDGHNGLLTDFFDAPQLAERVVQVLADPAAHAPLAMQARADMVERYDLQSRCLPAWLQLIR